MSELPSGDEYEALVQVLMARLAAVSAVTTERLDRPRERLPGASGTTHQIDVLWDFTDADGSTWRMLFEARSYRTRLKQSAVFAFHGVVEDIASVSSRRCVGVMVTTTGYQRGAQLVGDSHGVLLLEGREPSDGDFEGRIERLGITVKARLPFIESVQIQLYDGATETAMRALVEIEMPGGTRLPIHQVLLDGELASIGEPATPRHRVERRFGRGTYLVCDGEPVGEVEVIVAEVGETEADFSFQTGGRERLAWILKDATGGLRVWFAHDGRHWTTD